jgi:hypothetical protein
VIFSALKRPEQRRQIYLINGGAFGGCRKFKNCNTGLLFGPTALTWKNKYPYFGFVSNNRDCLAAELIPASATVAAKFEFFNFECNKKIPEFVCQRARPV